MLAARFAHRTLRACVARPFATAAVNQAKLIDGKAIAAEIKAEVAGEVTALRERYGEVPGLSVILVGDRPDSARYVAMKNKTVKELGFNNFSKTLPDNASQEELLGLIQGLNSDPKVHGILVQLPLPSHLDQDLVLSAIAESKDVDGFHPANVGRLTLNQGHPDANVADAPSPPFIAPCTPKGCIELLDRMNVPIEGKHAVVLGRSNIVGLPASLLLLHRNATVTMCHSKTEGMEDICRQADILVAAVGRAEMVKADWIKPGATVIDVGINFVEDSSLKNGGRMCGDVDFEGAKGVAGAITPVPGGVGPMTVAMLMRNTMDNARYFYQKTQGL